MGRVLQGGRIALMSMVVGSMVTACGTAAPTADKLNTKMVPLAAYPLAAPVNAYAGAMAAAVSELQPITTNIVGTSPWLGFPNAVMAAGAVCAPWPTFAGNIGAASVLNAQVGYLLGAGPVVGPGAYAGAGLLGVGWTGGLLGVNGVGGLLGPAAGVSTVMGMPWLSSGLAPLAGGAIGALPGINPGAAMQPSMPIQQGQMQQGQQPEMRQDQQQQQQQQPAQQQPAQQQDQQQDKGSQH